MGHGILPGDGAGDGAVLPWPRDDRIGNLPATVPDNTDIPTTIRYYRPADRVRLEAMYRDFEPKRSAQGLPPADEPGLRVWLATVLDRGIHIIADQNSELIGHAMLVPRDERSGSEFANFVHQSVRNRGIGTLLGRAALEAARAAGERKVWLSVEPSNRAAVRSYMRLGFRTAPSAFAAPEIEMTAAL